MSPRELGVLSGLYATVALFTILWTRNVGESSPDDAKARQWDLIVIAGLIWPVFWTRVLFHYVRLTRG